jgi:type II secretory pathway component PulF
MGIELEWAVLFVLHVLGTSVFGKFEAETPWWRLVLKWGIVTTVVLFTYHFFGHWAIAIILAFAILGITVHFIYCRNHGIHPFRATPRKKFYELRGWAWVE